MIPNLILKCGAKVHYFCIVYGQNPFYEVFFRFIIQFVIYFIFNQF